MTTATRWLPSRGLNVTLDRLTITAGEEGSRPIVRGKQGIRGAGLYAWPLARGLTLKACTFSNNSAEHYGGGAYFEGTATLINCTFTGNEAKSNGGGAYFEGTATLTNCTFTGNETKVSGGGLYVDGFPFTLQNSILIDNTDEDGSSNQAYIYISNSRRAENILNIRHNLIAGGTTSRSGFLVGSRNLRSIVGTVDESDASVVFASIMATENDYLHLREGSPAVNAGNNDYLNNGTPDNPNDDITTDAAGEIRIQRGTVDLGAYESAFKGTQVLTFTSGARGAVGTDIELMATASSGLPVTFAITEGDTLATLLVDTTLSLTGVGTVEITATQVGNANYAEATQTQTITVSQGTQTLKFISSDTGIVDTDIELMATASSGLDVTFELTEEFEVDGRTPATDGTVATLADNGTTLSLTGVGTVTITVTQVGDANYAMATQTQTITVSQGTQTLTFISDTTGTVGMDIELMATASSGLPVTFAITEGDTLATLVDTTLSLTGVGRVEITATAGDANYAMATQTQTITVSQGMQTLMFTSDTTGP